jgi:hypothetical protein
VDRPLARSRRALWILEVGPSDTRATPQSVFAPLQAAPNFTRVFGVGTDMSVRGPTHCTAMRRNLGELVAVGSMSAAVNMVAGARGRGSHRRPSYQRECSKHDARHHHHPEKP